MATSWDNTHLVSATASTRLRELVVGSSDLAHHESAITNKKIPYLPPFRNLPHSALGSGSQLNGHDAAARVGG